MLAELALEEPCTPSHLTREFKPKDNVRGKIFLLYRAKDARRVRQELQ